MANSPHVSTARAASAERPAYLVVDEFLNDLVGTRALKSALELGLVDDLVEAPRTVAQLAGSRGNDITGMRLLVDLLRGAGVVEESRSGIELTARFRAALDFRDLLETKLDFIGFVVLDFIDRFNDLVVDPDKFMREAQLFRLFDYRRAAEPGAENYAWTKVWMRLTTALTRYEAAACLAHYDFAAHARLLDIGGNSGEFVLRVCREHPHLQGAVMDLPVACEFGQDHLLPEPERERIRFVPGNALETPLPDGFDAISFKSMLHDWQEPQARRFLERAVEALEPGGSVLIFERGPLQLAEGPTPLSLLPILLFARSYRPAAVYARMLEGAGMIDVQVREVELETPFHLVTATKPAS